MKKVIVAIVFGVGGLFSLLSGCATSNRCSHLHDEERDFCEVLGFAPTQGTFDAIMTSAPPNPETQRRRNDLDNRIQMEEVTKENEYLRERIQRLEQQDDYIYYSQ